MMKFLKRLSSFVIALAIFFTAIPASAFYTDEDPIILADNATTQPTVNQAEEDYGEAYVLSEIESKRESNAKYYRMSNGSITAAIYPYDVHFADSNGKYQDIDNTLADGTDENDNVYSSKNNTTLVKFMKKSNENKLYTLNKGEYKIKTAIRNVNKVDAVLTEHIEDTTDNPYALDKLSGQVTYYGILPSIDIQYTYTSTMLKENIILTKATEVNRLEYTYHVNGSIDVVQNNDKSISVYEKGTESLIMEITAPTLWDSADNYSENLTITLLEAKNTEFTVRLDWTVPENAVYPVTIDPVMNFTATGSMIQDTHITTYGPNLNYDNNNHIRVSNRAYALVQYPLPTLQSGDKIINAQLVLTPYCMHPNAESTYSMANSYNPPVHVTAHAILRPWLEETATYNNIDPENGFYDSTVSAYRVVNGDNELYTWDVTRLANEWADGYSVNNGILLKFESPAPHNTFNAYFLATNGTYVSPTMYPAIIYQYINTTGIEDYLSYHTYDAGYAGTVYTNDLTGNVTVVNPIVQTGGNLMPINVSMVYNLDNSDFNVPYGRCWSMNWSQRLDKSSDYNFNNIENVRYRDGDGTEHYFAYDSDSGLYKDEINPDRTLSYNSSNGIFTMTDSSDSTMEFTRNGSYDDWYLTKVTDPYGNYITVTLNPSNYTQVTKVQSSTGNVVDFVYSIYGFLTEVKYYDGSTTKTIYIEYNNHSYPANNCIGKIIYADNTSVEYYYYNDTVCLSRIDDIDDYHINFGYTSGSPRRVNGIEEYSTDGTLGFTMSMRYEPTATYFNDITNSRQYLYTFAKTGTLKSAVDVTSNDGNGYGTYYEYNGGRTDILKGANNLTLVSKTQKSTVNILRNHSFEWDGNYDFNAWGEANSPATGGYTYEKSYIGSRSYKLTLPTTSTSFRILGFASLGLEAGVEYTLSAYVNTSEMTSNGGGASLYVIESEIGYESEIIKAPSNEWQRIFVTFTPSSSVTLNLCMTLGGATGSVYFDCIQLEKGGLSDYNLLDNPGFEDVSGSLPQHWAYASDCRFVSTSEKISGNYSAGITCGANQAPDFVQDLSIPNGKKGDTYVASAFAKAESIPASGWNFTLLVRFKNANLPDQDVNILFNSYSTEWQKVSGVAVAENDYTAVEFWLLYYNNCNTVYFDNAQLIRDTFGNTYTYDDKGNLISTVDLQGKQENTFSYDGNNQLIRQTNVGGGKIYYGYDLTRPTQLNFVSSGGVTTQYTYDSKGNVTQTQTHGSELKANSYYYIMNLYYNKYLDVLNFGNTNGTTVQYQFPNYSSAQRWKLIDKGDGTYGLEPECAPGMLLSVEPSTPSDYARVALFNNGGAAYQKIAPVKVDGNVYVLEFSGTPYSLDGVESGCYLYSTHSQIYQQFLFIPADNQSLSTDTAISSTATYTVNEEYMPSITDSIDETTSYTCNELNANSYYYIMNLFYNKYLGVHNSGNINGATVQYQFPSYSSAQRWKLIDNGDGTYGLEPECSPGLLLSVEPSTPSDYARVSVYNNGGAVYQKITLVKVQGNIYVLEFSGTPYSLDGIESGCYLYSTHGQIYQQFLFIPAENHNWSPTSSISSSATYTENGEYMSSITDSRGNTTSYTYNESRGYITSETNPKDVSTNYTYNGSELLTGVTVTNGTQSATVSYTYDNGKKLSSILSPSGTTYSFTYDGFARNLATKVGNRTLSSYTYNARSLPQTMTYGNGVTVSYGYDNLNRQTEFYVNNWLKYEYNYDGYSRLSELVDYSLHRKMKYEYDILGRPASEKV
ncbi:MAG: RICIN domain-containing protein, partial [Clostridia bacterium]|nr:RICIN domain-containing protein [Clostridia bacterium]